MFSVFTLTLGLSVLVLHTSALPFRDLLETRHPTPSTADTINAHDPSLTEAASVVTGNSAISLRSEDSVDLATSMEKRDDDPKISLVLSLLEGHGFQPAATSSSTRTKITSPSTTKATSEGHGFQPAATSSSTRTKASSTSTTKATRTSTTKATRTSTTKATRTSTTKVTGTLTTKTTTIPSTKGTTTTKATTAADARDLS